MRMNIIYVWVISNIEHGNVGVGLKVRWESWHIDPRHLFENIGGKV